MYWDLDKIIVNQHDCLPVKWLEMGPFEKIFVEIGFGNGENIEFLAKTYPDVLIVGIEVSQWCAAKGARRALYADAGNVRIMHGDARFLLRHCFEPESVNRVFMNFPCPWPKTRHAQRRVTVPAFTGLMEYLLEPGGAFVLATDVDWYAEEAAKAFAGSAAFEPAAPVLNPVRQYVTKYERKWKAMGKDTWGLTATKTERLKETPLGEENWPMEGEAVTKKNVSEVMNALKNLEGAGVGGKGHWIFRDAFISVEGAGIMLVITSDEGFEQHFYLKVLESPRGVNIKVDSVGHPYRTPAMRAALLRALNEAGRLDSIEAAEYKALDEEA